MNINVVSIQSASKPSHLAEVTIELSDADGHSVAISDISVLKGKFDHPYVAMPDKCIGRDKGQLRYRPLIRPNSLFKNRIDQIVLAAYTTWKERAAKSTLPL